VRFLREHTAIKGRERKGKEEEGRRGGGRGGGEGRRGRGRGGGRGREGGEGRGRERWGRKWEIGGNMLCTCDCLSNPRGIYLMEIL